MGDNEGLYESVVTSLPSGVCIVDHQGLILYLNPALEKMLNWCQDRTRGKSLIRLLEQSLVDPAQVVCWTAALRQALAHGRTTHLNLPAEMRAAVDGSQPSVVGVVAPMQDKGRSGHGALAMFHHAEMHCDLEDVRVRFLSAVSHEFGSPVTNLRVASDLLAVSLDTGESEQRKLLDVIQSETFRLQRLLAQFLPSADGRRTVPGLDGRSIALPPVLIRIAKGHQVRDPGRELVVQASADLPEVWGSEQKIEETVANLVDNAMHYGSPDAPIVLSARVRADDVVVSVSDQGPGMSKELEHLVYQPPWPCEPPDRDAKGNGLGLQIARTLVQALGGEFWYQRAPEGGACFCFSLPQAPAAESGRT